MVDRRTIELEEGWAQMQEGIDKLKRVLEDSSTEQFTATEYIKLYTTIYDMCTQKPPHDYSEQLYQRYQDALKRYITQRVLPALRERQGEALLRELNKYWSTHTLMVRWLSRFFDYLDRYYIKRHSLESLKNVGLLCFRDLVYLEMKGQAKDSLLQLIEQERDGEQIERGVLKGVLQIYIKVGLDTMECYQNDFEAFLLTESAEYYQRKAALWVQQDSCPDYLRKAEDCLQKEEERVDSYLDASSKSSLLDVVVKELLEVYETQLLEKENSGCAALLRDNKVQDLARMYRLFQRVQKGKGLEPVADIFRKHVEDEGMKLVKDVSQVAETKDKDGKTAKADTVSAEQQFVKRAIELHDTYLMYVTDCFCNSSLFHKALKEAFEAFCNKTIAGSSSAELMASFCDNLLKKGAPEKLSDDAIESVLDKVVKLLAYISDKDLFAEFYRKKLARRLLFDKSASDDHERSILTRFKQQCGAQFTTKMEGMVKDLTLARENQHKFDQWRNDHSKQLSIDLSVTVLTTGFWPTYKHIDLKLPAELVESVETFKEFYESTTKHRKLSWIYALGSCHVRGHFKSRSVELILSTFQAAVLMAFNDDEELSYDDIKERTNLPDEDLVRMLASLTTSRIQILKKVPESKQIKNTDKFAFNSTFTSKLARIRVPLPLVDEKKKVIEDVDKDRRYAIDAAIVRIMKSRKVLNHQNLVLEVNQQLMRMFKPDFKLIKKRIQDLIDRDYLERDKDNTNLFRYLA